MLRRITTIYSNGNGIMQKKSFVLCGLTCIAGIFGALIRWLQSTTAFEPETGLHQPFSMWSVILTIYLVLAAVVFFVVVRWLKGNKKLTQPMNYPEAFLGGPAMCTASGFAAFAMIAAGGVITLVDAIRNPKPSYSVLGPAHSYFDHVNGAMAVVAAICVIMLLRNINSSEKKSGAVPLVVIDLYLCFRLIAEYRSAAADPVVWNFAIRIIAISVSILAYYYFAGYAFDKAQPFKTLYFSLLGMFLGIIALADQVSIGYHLISMGILLAQLVLTILFIGNMALPSHEEKRF